jgi:hypothetical protein
MRVGAGKAAELHSVTVAMKDAVREAAAVGDIEALAAAVGGQQTALQLQPQGPQLLPPPTQAS